MTSQFWWWVARSSGMVAAVLIALTLIWGLLLTTKVIPRKGMPAWLTDMHRMLGGLSVPFIAVHMVALVLDSYAYFSWSELFVPFQSAYRAGAVAWGIGAFWLLVVVEGTSLLQRRMPRKVWRGLHYLSYPVAVMVAIHAMTAGADSGNPVFRVVTFGLMGVLTVLTAYRFIKRPAPRRNAAIPTRPPAMPDQHAPAQPVPQHASQPNPVGLHEPRPAQPQSLPAQPRPRPQQGPVPGHIAPAAQPRPHPAPPIRVPASGPASDPWSEVR